MPVGRLIRYNRNFGFVKADSENIPDTFIHKSDLRRGGLQNIKVGDPIVYEVGMRDGRECVVSCEPLKSWQLADTDD